MSEIGRQLVTNERRRGECRHAAKRVVLELLVATAAETDEALAELDVEAIRLLVQRLATQKAIMRNLLKERGELSAAAAGEVE